jgi:O-antigen/teichoic acid export membrane protein
MANRLFRRRSAAAAWIYASVACGILGTIVAARVLGLDGFGVFATSLAVVGFFQIHVDITVEESLTKYGFRYTEAKDWGRLRRLFRQMLLLKLVGGVLATLIVVLLAPFADELFDADGVTTALLAAALLPLVQSSENVATTPLLLHGRYDLRGAYQAGSAGLRLLAIVLAAPHGVTATLVGIVVAQLVATLVISVVGLSALGRFPAAPSRPLAEDVAGIRSFVVQSSIATGVISVRTTLVPIVLGLVAGPTQVGLFRVAQTPQTGLAAASSPARLVLLTEQTREWERGNRVGVLAGVRTYSKWAGGLMVVAVPVFFLAMPWLVRIVFGEEYEGAVDAARIVLLAAALHFTLGWTKSLPVTVGRPRLRIFTHGLETLVAVPLVAVLGTEWGATGAAVAVLVSSVVFALAWLVVLGRLRGEVAAERSGEAALQG